MEIQVLDEGDFPERTLFYWAREYSSALPAGGKYHELPRVVIISIVAFNLFDCEEYHSEFQPLEVTRHTPLTDRQSLHYFELPKLPEVVSADDELKLWLSLFKAETEEDLEKIEGSEVSVMQQAIKAYRSITATSEFQEKERLYAKARHDEAQALYHAEMVGEKRGEERGEERERAKWQSMVADKDAEITRLRAMLEETSK